MAFDLEAFKSRHGITDPAEQADQEDILDLSSLPLNRYDAWALRHGLTTPEELKKKYANVAAPVQKEQTAPVENPEDYGYGSAMLDSATGSIKDAAKGIEFATREKPEATAKTMVDIAASAADSMQLTPGAPTGLFGDAMRFGGELGVNLGRQLLRQMGYSDEDIKADPKLVEDAAAYLKEKEAREQRIATEMSKHGHLANLPIEMAGQAGNIAPLAGGIAVGALSRNPAAGVATARALSALPTVQAFGQDFLKRRYEQGEELDPALREAGMTGLIEMGTEMALPGFKAGKTAIGTIVRRAMGEGASEGLSQELQQAADATRAVTADSDKERKKYLDQLPRDDKGRLTFSSVVGDTAKAVELGALMGGGFSVPTASVEARQERTRSAIEDKYNELSKRLEDIAGGDIDFAEGLDAARPIKAKAEGRKDIGENILSKTFQQDTSQAIPPSIQVYTHLMDKTALIPTAFIEARDAVRGQMEIAAQQTQAALGVFDEQIKDIETELSYLGQQGPQAPNPIVGDQMRAAREDQLANQALKLYGDRNRSEQSFREADQNALLRGAEFQHEMGPAALPVDIASPAASAQRDAAQTASFEVPQEAPASVTTTKPSFQVVEKEFKPEPPKVKPKGKVQQAAAAKQEAAATLAKLLQERAKKSNDMSFGRADLPAKYEERVAKETPDIRQRREALFDEDVKTVADAVDVIGMALPKESGYHPLVKELSKVGDLKNLRFLKLGRDSKEVLGDSIGKFVTKGGVGHVYVRDTSWKEHGLTPEIILHEALHAATAIHIERVRRGKAEHLKPAYRSLELVRSQVARNLKSLAKESGVSEQHLAAAAESVDELISYTFTDPRIRYALANVKAAGNMSVLDKIIDAIAHLIGLNSKHRSLLENVLEHGGEFIKEGQKKDAPTLLELSTNSFSRKKASPKKPEKDIDVVRTGVFSDERDEEMEASAEAEGIGAGIQKLLRGKGNDTAGVREAKDRAAQRINARLVGFIVPSRNRVQKLMKQSKVEAKDIDLQNLKPLEHRAPALYKELREVKNHINEMSLDIYAALSAHTDISELSEVELNILTKIATNLDNYVTRQYKIDDPKGGKAYAEQLMKKAEANPQSEEGLVVANAKNYIAKQLLSFPANWQSLSREELVDMYVIWNGHSPDGLTTEQIKDNLQKKESSNPNVNDMADHMVRELLYLENKNSAINRYFNRGEGVNTTIITAREHVPEPIRELWGEIKDPIYNLYNTAQKMNQFLSRQRMLNEEYERGFGKFFFKFEGMTPEQRKRYTTTIPNTKEWGPLAGLKTTPRVAASLRAFTEAERVSSDFVLANRPEDWLMAKIPTLWRGFRFIARGVKYGSVVLNPANWVYNAVGAPMNLVMNGNVGTGLIRSAKVMKDLVAQAQKGQISEETVQAWLAGVVDNSFAGEIKEAEWQALMNQIFKPEDQALAKYLGKRGAKGWQDSKAIYRALKAGVTDVYAVMDLYAKVANFYYERDFLKEFYERQGIKKTSAQLTFDAGERTKRTNLTYTRAIPAARMLEGAGLTMFLTYTTETARTAFNNFAVGLQDIVNGQRIGDAGLTAHGLRRVMGAAGATAGHGLFLKTLALGAAKMFGVAASMFGDDDDEAKIKEGLGELYDNKELLEIFRGADGTRAFWDLSRFDPNDPVNSIVRAVGQGNLDEAVQGASDFLIMNTLFGRLLEQVGMPNNNPSIKQSNRGLYEDLMNVVTSSGISADLAGKFLRTMEPLIPSPIKTGYPNKRDDLPPAIREMDRLGFKPVIYKPLDEVARGYSRYAGIEKDVYSDLKKELESGKPYGLRSLEDVYVNAIHDEYKAFNDARKNIAGAEAAGVSRGKIMQQLKEGGADGRAIINLVTGRFQPKVMGPKSLSSLERELMQGKTMAERAAVRKQIIKLETELGKLSVKYRRFTKED